MCLGLLGGLASSTLVNSCCCLTGLCCWLPPVKVQYSVAKWLYFTLYLLTSVGTWVLRDYASDGFAKHVGAVKDYCSQPGTADPVVCAKGQIAYRISLANIVFYTLQLVMTLGVTKQSDWRARLHSNGWCLKLLVWAGCLVGFFFVPAAPIIQYAQAARYISGIFLVVQLILLIGLVYDVNEWLTSKGIPLAWTVLVGGSFVAWALGIAAVGLMYYYYAASPSCHLNIFFITFTLVLGLLMAGLLFVPGRAESAGLLTSGVVFLYACFLVFSALVSQPDSSIASCSRGTGTSPGWLQTVGFFIALATVLWATVEAGGSSDDMFMNKYAADEADFLPYRADFFHLVFVAASAYIAMLFSNWAVSPSSQVFEIDRGWASTWVKMASQWACYLLYGWSLVAPVLLPNRDFSRSGMV